MDITPGQAQWVIDRLIAERRISRVDVQTYVADMGREIHDIETRLAILREAAGKPSAASPTPRRAAGARKAQRRAGVKKGHPRGIAGTLAVLLRSIPAGEHAAINAIRVDKGIKAAIAAARKAISA
jgi:hypothetical protein